MAKEFSMQINRSLLNTNIPQNSQVDNDEMTKLMRVADDIMAVFDKHKVTMEDAYQALISLADSIYLYSTYDEKNL